MDRVSYFTPTVRTNTILLYIHLDAMKNENPVQFFFIFCVFHYYSFTVVGFAIFPVISTFSLIFLGDSCISKTFVSQIGNINLRYISVLQYLTNKYDKPLRNFASTLR
jgi:hypothetical protein